MSFKLELVAPYKAPSGTGGDYGYPVTVVPLLTPDGESAVNPILLAPRTKDFNYEPTTGGDQKIYGRKRVELDLEIDFISSEAKRAIDEMYWNGRSIYLCPNYGQSTLFSFPLFRNLTDVTGQESLTLTRAAVAYQWDAVDRVYRKTESGQPRFGFHGRYLRHLHTDVAIVNRATKSHPTAISHGWLNGSGTTLTYTESVLSPVLAQRIIANEKGVLHVLGAVDGVAGSYFYHTASSLDTTNDIVASVVVRSSGKLTFVLRDSALNNVAQKVVSADDLLEWTLVQISGVNQSGGTSGRLEIYCSDAATNQANADQVVFVGPVLIGSGTTVDNMSAVPAWHPSTSVADQIASTSRTRRAGGFTVSFCSRYQPWHQGFVLVNNSTGDLLHIRKFSTNLSGNGDALNVQYGSGTDVINFTNFASEFGLSAGDDFHLVLSMDTYDANLYVNGQAHSLNGLAANMPASFANAMLVGQVSASYTLSGSYLNLLRMDNYAWTQQEALDHYHTYGDQFGAGTVERLMGRLFTIDEPEWSLRSTGDGNHQWLGRLPLRELDLLSWAPLQKQENL